MELNYFGEKETATFSGWQTNGSNVFAIVLISDKKFTINLQSPKDQNIVNISVYFDVNSQISIEYASFNLFCFKSSTQNITLSMTSESVGDYIISYAVLNALAVDLYGLNCLDFCDKNLTLAQAFDTVFPVAHCQGSSTLLNITILFVILIALFQ